MLLLLGCASADGGWSKVAADPATTQQAYRECEAVARGAVAPQIGIDKDIAATRGNDWQRAQVYGQQTEMMRNGINDRMRSIIDGCMQAKGFSRGR